MNKDVAICGTKRRSNGSLFVSRCLGKYLFRVDFGSIVASVVCAHFVALQIYRRLGIVDAGIAGTDD